MSRNNPSTLAASGSLLFWEAQRADRTVMPAVTGAATARGGGHAVGRVRLRLPSWGARSRPGALLVAVAVTSPFVTARGTFALGCSHGRLDVRVTLRAGANLGPTAGARRVGGRHLPAEVLCHVERVGPGEESRRTCKGVKRAREARRLPCRFIARPVGTAAQLPQG